MRRLLAFVLLALLAVGAASVADHPGSVAIAWQGWEVDTSVGVLLAALLGAALVLWLVLQALTGVIRLPRRFRRNRRERRRRAGERALTRGMIALAAGDGSGAQRQALRAQALLGATPLSLLLAAQSAELNGDAAAAQRVYGALLDEREAAFLGLRGLVAQALRDGDEAAALSLAERARARAPDSPWVYETLLALEARAERWKEARDTLAAATRRKAIPAAQAAHRRGVILYELSREAERDGDRQRAIDLASEAQRLIPELAAPTVRHARLLLAEGRRRAARRVVSAAWRAAPHPDLAVVWGELGGAAPELRMVGWFERLAAQNPAAPESAVAVAEAALTAQLWGEARRHLDAARAAQADGPTRGLCLLMARLEDGEHPASGRGRPWLDRALVAPPDPTHVCARCGAETAEWASLCPYCRGFDTLAWRAPPGAPPRLPPRDPWAAAALPAIPDGLAAAGQSANSPPRVDASAPR